MPAADPPRDSLLDLYAVIVGLVIAAAALGIQWIADPATFAAFGFPPGMIYVVGSALIVWFNRRSPFAAAAGLTMGVWIGIGGLLAGEVQENLANPNPGVVIGNIVLYVGLVLSAVAGVISIVVARRHRQRSEFPPVSARNPRRVAAIVAICGLLLDAVGDALPEGFRWDGLGPLLFTGLAVAVALVPGRVMMQMAVLICFSFIGGALASAEFMDRLINPAAAGLEFAGAAMQLLGLALTLLMGLRAAIPARPRGSGVDARSRTAT